jgi:hypothetical protein
MSENKKIQVLFRHRSMEMGGWKKVLSMLNNLNPDKFDLTICLLHGPGELRNEIPPCEKVYLTEGKENFSKIRSLINFSLYAEG